MSNNHELQTQNLNLTTDNQMVELNDYDLETVAGGDETGCYVGAGGGALSAGATGALAGAAAGSAVPGIGTVAGGIIGGAAGAIAGGGTGCLTGSAIEDIFA